MGVDVSVTMGRATLAVDLKRTAICRSFQVHYSSIVMYFFFGCLRLLLL